MKRFFPILTLCVCLLLNFSNIYAQSSNPKIEPAQGIVLTYQEAVTAAQNAELLGRYKIQVAALTTETFQLKTALIKANDDKKALLVVLISSIVMMILIITKTNQHEKR